jgi:hypothetical protein
LTPISPSKLRMHSDATRRTHPPRGCIPVQTPSMPAVKGRSARPATDEGTVPLQGKVSPRIRDKARKAASAAGISMAQYLEQLVERDEVDQNGCPLWLQPRPSNQEVLPLGKIA